MLQSTSLREGKRCLDKFYDLSRWDIKTVKTGDTLKIGKRKLLFIETPNAPLA